MCRERRGSGGWTSLWYCATTSIFMPKMILVTPFVRHVCIFLRQSDTNLCTQGISAAAYVRAIALVLSRATLRQRVHPIDAVSVCVTRSKHTGTPVSAGKTRYGGI